MENCLKTIGNQIRIHRKSRGISQKELGRRAGLHPTYIGQIERGEKNITVISLNKISNALDISLSCLIEEEKIQ